MELCLINFRIASTLSVWNIESHACIRISFVACKYLTIDSTGRQSSFEPMRMRRIIDTPCHQLAVLTRLPTSWVEGYDASQIYRRRWLVWPRIWNGVPRSWSQKNAAQGRPIIHILAILGNRFPTWIGAWKTSVEMAWPSLMTIELSLAVISLVLGCLEALINPSLCKFGSPPPPRIPISRALLPGGGCQTGRQMDTTSPSTMRIEIRPSSYPRPLFPYPDRMTQRPGLHHRAIDDDDARDPKASCGFTTFRHDDGLDRSPASWLRLSLGLLTGRWLGLWHDV